MTLRAPKSVLALVFVVSACGSTFEPPAPPLGVSRAALTQLTNFGSNPGSLNLYEFDPPSASASAGLVVVLHGCTESAAQYQVVGWEPIASANGFFLLYAETTTNVNCFQWFEPTLADRDVGQALSIIQGVRFMQAHHAIDPTKIFVTGFSAGGAMTAMMLGDYPDVFAAGSINAGVPYDCARNLNAATACQAAMTMTPQAWGDKLRAGFPGYSGPYPRLQVFQGTNDVLVSAGDETELMKQWTNVLGIDQTPDVSDTTGVITHNQYQDTSGKTLVDTYLIVGMPHAVAVDPGHGCGSLSLFTVDVGLCSPLLAAKFFGLAESSGAGGGGGSAGTGGGGSASHGCSSTGLETMSGPLVLLWLLRRRRFA